MALAKDTPLPIVEGFYNDYPVAVSTKIYEGAVVSMVAGTGHAKGYAGTDTVFLGIADRQADNSAGAAAAITVRVRKDKHRREVTLASVAITDVGAAVYASDDATFTKTSTSNLLVGKISRYVGTNTCEIEFLPLG